MFVPPTVALQAIGLAHRAVAGFPRSRPESLGNIGVVRHIGARRPLPGSATEHGTRYQEAARGDEGKLVHADGNHPRRQLINPEAERQGDTRRAANEDAEDEETFRDCRGAHLMPVE